MVYFSPTSLRLETVSGTPSFTNRVKHGWQSGKTWFWDTPPAGSAAPQVADGGDAAAGGPPEQVIPLVAAKLQATAEKQQPRPQPPPPTEVGSKTTTAVVQDDFVPQSVPYLLIGAGAASFAAFRAIRAADQDAKVFVIGDEPTYPYMRRPLSKELWSSADGDSAKTLKFRQWNGRERSIFFEPDEFYLTTSQLESAEHGGVAVLRGKKVVKLDPNQHLAYLDDGRTVQYGKCLIATGAMPQQLPEIAAAGDDVLKRVTLFRTAEDFQRLSEVARKVKSVAIIGGGYLGSELACALAKRGQDTGLKVTQLFAEKGNLSHILPEYLSRWTTDKVRKESVNVLGDATISSAKVENDQVVLQLSDGSSVLAEHVVVALGTSPNVELAESSELEVDKQLGGFRADSELRARSDVWVAGSCSSFYDVKLGRRRVEDHDHAGVTGRLAGENMTGAGKPYWRQSMSWCDLGPNVGLETLGIVDASLPTVGVFAKAGGGDDSSVIEQPEARFDQLNVPAEGDDYSKGVVFYLSGKQIVGIALWNLFNRMPIARKILGEEFDDFGDVAKLFDLHGKAAVDEEEDEVEAAT